MSYAPVVRTARQPLTWLVIVAMALLAMLALEASGTSHAPSLIPLNTVSNSGATDNHGGQPTRHCTDGHGQDNPKNPHCRGISG